ncbi:MAG: hypothetical protein WC285_03925 [Candidatus Gracilibacteria bacterium]|jgi:hypothetical protein
MNNFTPNYKTPDLHFLLILRILLKTPSPDEISSLFGLYELSGILPKSMVLENIEKLMDSKAIVRTTLEIDKTIEAKENTGTSRPQLTTTFNSSAELRKFFGKEESAKYFSMQYTLWFEKIEINKKKMEELYEEYFQTWLKNNIRLPHSNYLKAEKQLEAIAKHIFDHVEKYGDKNFLLKNSQVKNAEFDFTTALLFLEHKNLIKIHLKITYDLNILNASDTFETDIEPAFYQIFKQDTEGNIKFSMERLIQAGKIQNTERIKFIPPKCLKYGDIEYEIKQDCIPQQLLALVRENLDGVSVLMKDLIETTGEPIERVKKALNNFRKNLREKFKTLKAEKFFKCHTGKIIFDENLFDFSE